MIPLQRTKLLKPTEQLNKLEFIALFSLLTLKYESSLARDERGEDIMKK